MKAKILGFLSGKDDSAIDLVIKSVQALNTSLNKDPKKSTDVDNKIVSEYGDQNNEEVNTIMMGVSPYHHDA